jgi:hypothetical protein
MQRLAYGQLLSLYPTQSSQLRVSRGRLWITADDSPEDYFISAGEMLQLGSGTHVVLEAWPQSKLETTLFDFTTC